MNFHVAMIHGGRRNSRMQIDNSTSFHGTKPNCENSDQLLTRSKYERSRPLPRRRNSRNDRADVDKDGGIEQIVDHCEPHMVRLYKHAKHASGCLTVLECIIFSLERSGCEHKQDCSGNVRLLRCDKSHAMSKSYQLRNTPTHRPSRWIRRRRA